MCQSLVRLAFFVLIFFSNSHSFAQSIDSVKIGNGGGFAGQTTVFKIVGKKIWKAQGMGALVYTQEAKLTRKSHKQIKKGGQALLSEAPFNHPANMYKWVELFSQGKSYKFVWGDPQFSSPNTLLSYYQFIIQLVPTLIFK